MKKLIFAVAALATVVSAQAQLFNNASGRGLFEPLGMGTEVRGAGGFYSVLQGGNNTFGVNDNSALSFRLADDFTNSVSWTLASATVFAYQTGATNAGITGGILEIRSGSATGTLEATGTYASTAFTSDYRTSTSGSGDTRHVQAITFNLSGSLGVGTHWLVYSTVQEVGQSSGPFTPFLTSVGSASPTGSINAMQSSDNGATFAQVFDGVNTTAGQDLPFLINGSAVPEPASFFAVGAGILGLALRRRKNK